MHHTVIFCYIHSCNVSPPYAQIPEKTASVKPQYFHCIHTLLLILCTLSSNRWTRTLRLATLKRRMSTKSRIKNLSLSFRNSKLFDPLMGTSLASVTTCFGVGGYALTVRSYPSLANTILMVSNGAGGGVMSGSFAALVFETFADSLDEWYGHEYGQAVRLLGVAAGGASVVAGVVSAAGVFSFGLGLFTPVFFITFGLTLGGTCLYRWNARRRSTKYLQSMRK